MENRIFVAAAGAGKTTHLVETALRLEGRRVLFTTFTDENMENVRRRFYDLNDFIPKGITLLPWYSFLIKHGINPFLANYADNPVEGIHMGMKPPEVTADITDVRNFYFTKDNKIYKDHICGLAYQLNLWTGGVVLKRLKSIFDHVFIDELQDIAGYDFDFIKLMMDAGIGVTMVCDPKQAVYSTSLIPWNKQYKGANAVRFFRERCPGIVVDATSLNTNHRCCAQICRFADLLWEGHAPAQSGYTPRSGHVGIFIVHPKDAAAYLRQYKGCMQLTWDKDTDTVPDHRRLNFGKSKGCTYERVMIYPTETQKAWLKSLGGPGKRAALAPMTRAKLYVGITRARESVAFVMDWGEAPYPEGVAPYQP